MTNKTFDCTITKIYQENSTEPSLKRTIPRNKIIAYYRNANISSGRFPENARLRSAPFSENRDNPRGRSTQLPENSRRKYAHEKSARAGHRFSTSHVPCTRFSFVNHLHNPKFRTSLCGLIDSRKVHEKALHFYGGKQKSVT